MPDREKVILALELCRYDPDPGQEKKWYHSCLKCPYCVGPTGMEMNCAQMYTDAIALLREQEPRVMTLKEIRMHEVYWAEQENVSRPWPIAMHHIRNAGLLDGPVYQDYMGDNYNTKEYGKTWRCWTARPTDEQRKAVKWDADD